MRRRVVLGGLVALSGALAACGGRAETWTLYRNSGADQNARIHFTTMDSAQNSDPDFNAANCGMTAKLLNDNVARLNDGQHPVRFWCELGSKNNLS